MAVVPRDSNYVILAADYSQIELRIMAGLSKDDAMLDAFRNGKDIHEATAARVFAVPLEEVNSDMRNKAKTINFGIIYGMSPYGLANKLRISSSDAKTLIIKYRKQYPGIVEFEKKSIAQAKSLGYVQTFFGRKRYLPDIHHFLERDRAADERKAVNTPIQGTAAEMIKIAMIRIHDAFKQKRLSSKLILQVHDELVFEVLKSELMR